MTYLMEKAEGKDEAPPIDDWPTSFHGTGFQRTKEELRLWDFSKMSALFGKRLFQRWICVCLSVVSLNSLFLLFNSVILISFFWGGGEFYYSVFQLQSKVATECLLFRLLLLFSANVFFLLFLLFYFCFFSASSRTQTLDGRGLFSIGAVCDDHLQRIKNEQILCK